MSTPDWKPPPYHEFQLTMSCETVARTSSLSEASLRASSTRRRTHRSPARAWRKAESQTGTHHSSIMRTARAERARDSSAPTGLTPERSTRSAQPAPLDLLRTWCMSFSMRVAQSTTSVQSSVWDALVARPSTWSISASSAAKVSGRSSSSISSSSPESSPRWLSVRLRRRSRKICFFLVSISRRSPAARFSCSVATRSATCEA
mmetsp:Transcript_28405/g.57284  ORF Transcript_28405/g.57284 Transcript_28405/m.57284 type:complete len:204 (+) Transcript_28405:1360-1971(+)